MPNSIGTATVFFRSRGLWSREFSESSGLVYPIKAKVDKIKERISYLKFWLGIFVVTLISLIGWLVSNYETAKRVLIVLDMFSILVILVMVLVIHRTIQKLIQTLEEL